MALSKAKIFNLALSALLLQRRTVDPDTDQSNEVKVLLTHWEIALDMVLEDLDLDSTAIEAPLALVVADPTTEWDYAYAYPADCVFFRRIKSIDGVVVDNKTTHMSKMIRIFQGQKVIFANKEDAVAEYISNTVNINTFSANLGLSIAYRLALLSAPLVVGKGAKSLMDKLEKNYVIAKGEAQEKDQRENFNFQEEALESEFVEVRTT